MIHLTLEIEPVAWGRVKRGAYGQAYVPPKTARFKHEVALLLRKLLGPTTPRRGPIRLTLKFIIPTPKRPKRMYPTTRPDLDNYTKALKDAANGILWIDDSQVVQYGEGMGKYYDMSGGKPRIEIKVEELG